MDVVKVAKSLITVDMTEREYVLITAVFREIMGAMPREDFTSRVGADIAEIKAMAKRLLAEGERVDVTEF
ncbi:MAG: hypothetical protein B7Z26_11140 [Asticcacaulis sp. 32-58-5]|nr:MAG: hypothetical protein B7Z26_11140 [Asticcacaulis sp. 32-58-5]